MSAGDLSLSQSLGGLRIANPDEDAVASPTSPTSPANPLTRPPPPSSHSSASTVTEVRKPVLLPTLSSDAAAEEGAGLGFDPATYGMQSANGNLDVPPPSQHTPSSPGRRQPEQGQATSRSRGLAHQNSMPLGYQAQQAMQYPSYAPNHAPPPMRAPGPQSTSTRPISSFYAQPNISATSAASSHSSYRYRDEIGSSDGSSAGLARSGSRSARSMMDPSMGRDGSRSYRQGGGQTNGGNGPLPPRRNSKRGRGPTGPQYDPEQGSDSQYTGTAPQPKTAEEWRERGAAVSTRQETDASGQTIIRTVKKGVKDFNFGRTLGEGSYSTVLAATDRQTLKEYAIKVLDKRHIIKEKKVKYVNIERDTLNRLTEHPGIVRLYYTFQDERSLYFVLDLASGGELLGVLKKMGSFDVECTRFYGAEILDSVAYMHSRGIIHRDLKPENVLLDKDMHVKITDFGTAKILPDPKTDSSGNPDAPGDPTDGAETDRAMSFVGTAEYVSPELLRDKNACKASDLWAFGCIIFQLLAGRPPFKAANEYLTFQKILALDYTFPDGFPEVARDLVERLLVLEPSNRLPVEHIRTHRFFEGVQWGKGLWRQKAPRLKAYVPPPAEPIKLNGASQKTAVAGAAAAMNAAGAVSLQPAGMMGTPSLLPSRPQLRGVTELPPPSQLDIDWSPVLTKANERILKLGNLIVFSGPSQAAAKTPNGESGDSASTITTPAEKPKFMSFFSGSAQKKKERLVLISSCARLVIAAAGGNEKKAKMEVNLLAPGTSWRTFVDAKGLTGWALDTKDKHLTFEDPRATTSDPAGSKFSTAEWIESLEQAREVAVAQSFTTSSSSYSNSINGLDVVATSSSPADSLGGDLPTPGGEGGTGGGRHTLRQTLRKAGTDDSETFGKNSGGSGGGLGRKRFSKRHSKSGLAAVF